MSAPPVAILGAGMTTGVGLTAPASCAAIRCGIDNFRETRFMSVGGEWIIGSEVPLDQPWRGQAKLVKMLAGPLRECLDLVPEADPGEIPLLLCLAEADRPGRLPGLSNAILDEAERELGLRFSQDSRLIPEGRVGGALALQAARALLHQRSAAPPYVLVAGVDSYLVGPTLRSFEERYRLLTSENSDGFIPGEAAGAVLLARPERAKGNGLTCLGMGFGQEPAPVESGEPLRAEGLSKAIAAALQDSANSFANMDYRITDNSGEQYGFKEASLALTRLLRERKEEFDIWHPADCIGEVGAAALPCMLGIGLAAAWTGYAKGRSVLCHLGNDDGRRAALVLRAEVGS